MLDLLAEPDEALPAFLVPLVFDALPEVDLEAFAPLPDPDLAEDLAVPLEPDFAAVLVLPDLAVLVLLPDELPPDLDALPVALLPEFDLLAELLAEPPLLLFAEPLFALLLELPLDDFVPVLFAPGLAVLFAPDDFEEEDEPEPDLADPADDLPDEPEFFELELFELELFEPVADAPYPFPPVAPAELLVAASASADISAAEDTAPATAPRAAPLANSVTTFFAVSSTFSSVFPAPDLP